MLAPADASTFQMASMELEKDDSHTVEARFRFQVFRPIDDQEEDREPGPVYIELEGIGMLMRDRDTSVATHTMWVIKPVNRPSIPEDQSAEDQSPTTLPVSVGSDTTAPTTYFAQGGLLTHETLLCRICERQVPTWFFEKHNETCNEEHRLEADIAACNERLSDLCQVVQKLNVAIDEADASRPPEYQGLVVYSLPDSVLDNASPTSNQPHLVATRKVQHGLLEEAINVLTAAHEISTPSVKEEDADTPVHAQRVLSPNSEDRLSQVARWKQPPTEDRALSLLLSHVDTQVRQKQIAVNRMRNTILYSERVRQEWEDKVDRMLAIEEESSDTASSTSAGSEGARKGASGSADDDVSPPTRAREVTPLARLPITKTNPRTSPTHPVMLPPISPTDISTQRTRQDSRSPSSVRTATADRSPVGPPTSKPASPLLSPPVAKHEGHHSRRVSTSGRPTDAPLSPRIPALVPQSRTAPTSIKDFEIIKPISRGAFGSVYLAKKVATGDYFAIKALKKSDMIAKNQITNVKAERTILMNQASSPYVVKLFFSFQSKDYLYLVMEYLNGGDCASLVKTLGGLSEDWARNYIAEVVLGLEYLHAKGVVHR